MNNKLYKITFVPRLISKNCKYYEGTLSELANDEDLKYRLQGVKPRTINGFINRLNNYMKKYDGSYWAGSFFGESLDKG